MAARPDVYTQITQRIIDSLEAGVVPWRRPWRDATRPRNIAGRPYRGINALLLGLAPYESPHWLTFRQAKNLGGSVRKGERGTQVVLWKPVKRRDADAPDTSTGGETRDERGYLLVRTYTVFNTDQCDLPDGTVPEIDTPEPVPTIDACEQIVAAMPDPPAIRHGGDRAAYSPLSDAIRMPQRDMFTSADHYYATLFHELGHATGHRRRLNRTPIGDSTLPAFGTPEYAAEELVAEISAAFVSGAAGLDPSLLDASASYLASWLTALRNDKRLILVAAGRAQHAADWILDRRQTTATTEPIAA